MQITVHIL